MNVSRQFLLGLLALGLYAGFAAALEPAPALPLAPPVAPAVTSQDPGIAEACCATCSDPAHLPSFVGGVGLYMIQPYFQNNPAYNVLLESHGDPNDPTRPTNLTVDRVNVSHHMDVAPLVWLGFMTDDGWGGRARYWYFRQGSLQTVNLPPFTGMFEGSTQLSGTLATVTSATPQGLQAFGNTFSKNLGPQSTNFDVTTELEVQVLDIEAMQDFRTGPWDFLLSGGVRIARLDQTYNVYEKDTPDNTQFRTLLSSYNFQGAGPVVALEIRRALGESGLNFYTSARGSVVIGSAQQNALFSGLVLRNEDPNPQFAAQHWNRGLPVGEMELGLEYGRDVGTGRLFGQIALVGQDWFGAGNASRSAGLTPPSSPNPVSGGVPVDSDIAFFGLSFRIGLNY